MLGHSIVYGADATSPLLMPVPLATAAATIRRVTGLSPAAAAYHAAAGNAYTYAGTLVIANRDVLTADGVPTTTVEFVEPAVVRHDVGGLLVALGATLPAGRLAVRCAPDVTAPQRSRLQAVGRVFERAPMPVALGPGPDIDVRVARNSHERAFVRRQLHRSVPDRAISLLACSMNEPVGQLTWAVRSDALDRRRRAEVVALSLPDSRRNEVLAALLRAMGEHVGRAAGLTMKLVSDIDSDIDESFLCASGWTHSFTLRGMDPWMRSASKAS
jgi:hypothetical protein